MLKSISATISVINLSAIKQNVKSGQNTFGQSFHFRPANEIVKTQNLSLFGI